MNAKWLSDGLACLSQWKPGLVRLDAARPGPEGEASSEHPGRCEPLAVQLLAASVSRKAIQKGNKREVVFEW